VFGNGTRVVWHIVVWSINGAQHDEGAEGALIHQVKAGFVAVQQGQRVRGGKGVEGDDHALHHRLRHPRVRLEGHLLIEHAGFERPGAALAPVSGAHFLDHAELDFAGGAEAVDVLLEENREVLARFAIRNDTFGAQAVTDGV
jgi:hypothetical protein